jgi:hypothetical protein
VSKKKKPNPWLSSGYQIVANPELTNPVCFTCTRNSFTQQLQRNSASVQGRFFQEDFRKTADFDPWDVLSAPSACISLCALCVNAAWFSRRGREEPRRGRKGFQQSNENADFKRINSKRQLSTLRTVSLRALRAFPFAHFA